jgi:hypothetical protein
MSHFVYVPRPAAAWARQSVAAPFSKLCSRPPVRRRFAEDGSWLRRPLARRMLER